MEDASLPAARVIRVLIGQTDYVWHLAWNDTKPDTLRARRGARTRSFSELGNDIESGIDRVSEAGMPIDPTTPEQRVAATELALVCTQGMLMALEPGQRLAYLLDEVMGFDGETAAEVAGVSHEAFRQRLARAREALRHFVQAHCGLVSATARCHCDRQLQGLAPASVQWLATRPLSNGQPVPLLKDVTVRQGVQDIRRLQSVAQLFRAHPQHTAAPDLAQRVREQVAATVFGGSGHAASPA